ncbi:MAG: zinc ABC transporter substrate-binding protein [Opitutales bacterium]|nr:zinc ABC transporter substrate-binding protein [Opitutales bacterium]
MGTHMIQGFPFFKRMRGIPFQGLVSFLLVVAGLCIHDASGEASTSVDRITIGAGMPAAAFLAREIGEDKVDVITALPEGSNHEFSSITAKTVSKLLEARVFLTIGLPFEEQIADSLQNRNPKLIIVHLEDGIRRIAMGSAHDHADHHHTPNCHTGTTEDPHIWMDPLNMIHMAQALEAALAKELPSASDALAANSKDLVERLENLHETNLSVLRPMYGATLLSYHAAFGYYADAYGLKQLAIESEGKSPSARKIADMMSPSKEQMIACMLIQPQFDTPPIRRLASRIGLPAEVIDPLSTDYFGMMERLRNVLLNHYSKDPET